MGLIASFRLPLELCPPTNRTRGAQAWQQDRTKRNCWAAMLQQYVRQLQRMPPRVEDCPPLGRYASRVVCTRHSSVQPDRWSDWAKIPVDLLCVPRGRRRRGLGLIWDDAPKHCDVDQRWELAPKGAGYVTIEVFE